MSPPTSLVWRLVSRTLAAQVILLVFVAAALAALNAPPDGEGFFWWQHASKLIVSSLTRDTRGNLRLDPSPELLDFQARRPGFLFGASVDGPGEELVQGSSPRLIDLFHKIQPLRTHTGAFLVDPSAAGPPLNGGTLLTDTIYGPINVFAANGHFQLEDLPAYAAQLATDVAQYALPALFLGAICMATIVRRELRPLRAAGRDMMAATEGLGVTALPEDRRVPREMLPVVRGVNRALRRLEEGLHGQRRFVANAAHEMRTPLGVLRARIDSLENPKEQVELRRDAQRIVTLLDQLLAIARLEQRDLPVTDAFDLGACARTVVADLVPLALDAGRSLAFEAPQGPVRVWGSAEALASAITNLIDNALAAEPVGGCVEVLITQGARASVADHGAGVRNSERHLLFEPFWRGDKDRVGSGLGLAIVRDIVALHHGTIRIEDTPGGGATFVIELPEFGAAKRPAAVADATPAASIPKRPT